MRALPSRHGRYLPALWLTGLELRRSWISRHLGNGRVDAIFCPLVHVGRKLQPRLLRYGKDVYVGRQVIRDINGADPNESYDEACTRVVTPNRDAALRATGNLLLEGVSMISGSAPKLTTRSASISAFSANDAPLSG